MKKNSFKRQRRVRVKMIGTHKAPRLSVHRSNKFMYAQLIDDTTHKTLLSLTEKHVNFQTKMTKSERAKELGKEVAKKAKEKKIANAVFDRGSFAYHGRVKAVAEGLREEGLKI